MQNVVIFKKLTWGRYFAAVVYLSEIPSPPRFCFGWSRKCVGSESGQIQSVKLGRGRRGAESWTREKGIGATGESTDQNDGLKIST